MIVIEYKFGDLVGRDADDLLAIGYRYDSVGGFPWNCASYVVQTDPSALHALEGGVGMYTGIWQSPTGRVYVADAHNAEVMTSAGPSLRSTTWRQHSVGFAPAGVWGLDDAFVLTWGGEGNQEKMACFDGNAWQPMPAPGDMVMKVHGLARDLIYAVGKDGMIARWDGSRWHRVDSPVSSTLSSVFVASPDEIWACSNDGRFLEGSTHGWGHVLDHGEALFDVVQWRGTVWVAAPFEGLLSFDGKKLVNVKDNAFPKFLHAAPNALLASCDDRVMATQDGKAWRGRLRRQFAEAFKGRPAEWAPTAPFEDTEGA